MVNRSGRGRTLSAVAPLLLLLFIGRVAAAPFSPRQAYIDARAAADRYLRADALEMAGAALARAGTREDEWVWALKILQAELLWKQQPAAKRLLQSELPPQFRNSEAAVWRLLMLGREDPAALKRALQLASNAQPHLVWRVHLTAASSATHRRNFAEANAALAAALGAVRHTGDRLGIATVYAAESLLRSKEQRYRHAIDAGQKALATFTALRATGRIASVAGNLGWAYLELGDWDTAQELFTTAVESAKQSGRPDSELIWVNHLGNISFVKRRYAEAEQYYNRAFVHARTVGEDQAAAILTNLARTALAMGKLDDADRLVASALEWHPDEDQKLRAQIVGARIAMARGDYGRAEKTLRDAAAKAVRVTRWTAQAHLAQVYARTKRNELAERMFRSAIETAAEQRKIIDDELRLSFYNTAADVFASYVDYLVTDRRIVEALAATELIRAQSLEQGRTLAGGPRDFDTRAIARQRGATILTYSLGPERSHLWISTASGITHVLLPPSDEIERQVGAYRRSLGSYDGTLAKSAKRGQQLYQLLVGPAAAYIARGSRVLVVADGVLHALNFETLVVPDARPRYWIEDVVVSNAPSLQLLSRTSARSRASASMLLLGDPVTADAAFPKLKHAADEIGRVRNHFSGAVVLAGAAATPAAYKAVKPQRFEYMHVVAHGVSSRNRPLESAIILSRDASEGYKLFARDVVAQPLQARLVTLSSCRGAGERTFTGEGLVGLAWAFLRAGTDQVVAALWDVNDDATPELMDRMYAGIRAGRPPDIALRDAKLVLVKGKGIHRMAHYWAPFVLYSGS